MNNCNIVVVIGGIFVLGLIGYVFYHIVKHEHEHHKKLAKKPKETAVDKK